MKSCTHKKIPQLAADLIRPIYIGKNQNPKHLGFVVVPFTLPETPITFRFFWLEKRMRKTPESHTGFLVRGAHARLLSTFDRTYIAQYVAAGDSVEGQKPKT